MTPQKPLIYLAIKYHPDHSNRSLIEEISDACKFAGYETVCVNRDIELYGGKSYSASELMQLSFDKIKKADYILIDLSEKGVGIGIEAGYAYALGIPIITILPVTAHLSTTLAGISNFVYHYQTPDEVSGLLKSILYSEND